MQNSEVVWEFTVEEKNKIGEGAFSIVYKCYSKTLKKDVALKSLKSYYDKDTVDYNKEFNREITSLKEAQNCDNIIQYFGITKDSNMREYMVLQYANNGDLRGYLKANFNELKWLDQLKMAKEIASGIFHLHNKGIVHRDLHDKNVLVHGGRLIIADLGLSKSLSSTSKTDTHVGGMPGYRDPKYLNDKAYKREKPSDIYSLGVLFWELTSGNPPFMNREIDIAIHVINNGRETSIPGTPDDFVNLYKKAWHSEPEERPTIEKICLELDIQLYPKQIARGLNSLSCYNCSLEDRAYFTVRFFGGLVQDENFTKFVRQSVQTFFQGLKGLSQEEGAVRLEESRQEFVAANKVVKVIWFLVAAALEIAVISANFYFLDAVSVVLNCFSAIITFIAIAIRRENVATFAVEGIFVALKLLFMNMIPLTILFAAGNVAFAFYVFKVDFEDFSVFFLHAFDFLNAIMKFFYLIFIISVKLTEVPIFAVNWFYKKLM